MKKVLLLLFLVTLSSVAQNTRVTIKGQVLVPDGNDNEGITVYNTSSNQGTITDDDGAFTLKLAKMIGLFLVLCSIMM